MPPKKHTHSFVSAPAHTCHLSPGLVTVVPVRWHWGEGGGSGVGCGFYVWVDEPSL